MSSYSTESQVSVCLLEVWTAAGNLTHIPHSSSSYHSSWGTILSISSNVRITLAPLVVVFLTDLVGDMGSSSENRTRGDAGEVGDGGYLCESDQVSLVIACREEGKGKLTLWTDRLV